MYFYVIILNNIFLHYMSPSTDPSSLEDLPHYEVYVDPPEQEMIRETPEEYFARLTEEARRNFPVDPKVERREDDARCSHMYRTLKELQKERRALLWSLLKHPVASPSGLVGLGILGLTALNLMSAGAAAVGEVVNAGVAGYVIKRKMGDLRERMDRCTRAIEAYRQKYGDTATDILSADVENEDY